MSIESELTVESHEFHLKSNNASHHTSEYDFDNALIVRRGQQFTVSLTFGREFNKETDRIVLQFTTGENRSTFGVIQCRNNLIL